MSKPDWMPKEPSFSDGGQARLFYLHEISAQKSLLEHLIAEAEPTMSGDTCIVTLRDMLRQLMRSGGEIYKGLVICHPREYCTTFDFCTHYIPHVKGDACSCDSCESCDFETVVEHRKKPVTDAISANNQRWIEQMEKSGWIQTWRDNQVCNYRCFECETVSKDNCDYYEWQQFKNSMEREDGLA